MADTPDEKAAEVQGRALDGRIFRIDEEIRQLQQGPARIAELQAERAAIVKALAPIASQRPKKPANAINPERAP